MANTVGDMNDSGTIGINQPPTKVPKTGVDPNYPHPTALLLLLFCRLARKANIRQS
jgi:hypothetical protein